MDNKESGKESSEDVTRESLIAISYRLPGKDPGAEKSSKYIYGERVAEPPVSDGDEKYRSKLVSLSYSPSPDAEVLRALPRQADG